MTSQPPGVFDRAAQLRREFDETFAVPLSKIETAFETVLMLRLGDERYGLRLSDVATIAPLADVTPLPGAPASLVGLGAFRGSLLAVYDLARLAGVRTAEAPAWFAIAAGTTVALAFTAVDGVIRVRPEAFVTVAAIPGPAAFAREAVEHGGRNWPIVPVQTVIDSILTRTQAASSGKE